MPLCLIVGHTPDPVLSLFATYLSFNLYFAQLNLFS